MLRPVRMKLVKVLILRDDLSQAVRALTEAGCLEVTEPSALDSRETFKKMDTAAEIALLGDLKGRLEAVAETLDLPSVSRHTFSIDDIRIAPHEIRGHIESEYATLEQKVRRIAFETKRDRDALSSVELTAWVVSSLEARKVDPVLVSNPVFIGAAIGTLPTEVFTRTRKSLALAGHALFGLGSLGNRTFVASVTTAERAGQMQSGLKAARFEAISVRKDLVGEGHFDTQAAELEMWETRERLTENGLALVELAGESERLIAKWLAEIDLNARLLAAMNNFLEGEYTCLVTGWAPAANIKFLKNSITERCGSEAEIIVADNLSAEVEGPKQLTPPTMLLSPRWVRPFELIIDLYGTPAYDAINPTLFVAFTFVLLFGAMFGDVGHGAVLVAVGLLMWFLAKRRSTTKDLGFILAGCGIGSIVFGLLYGETFGFHTPAYWRRPMEDPAGFLVFGVILGAIIINLGLAINVFQNVWAGRYKEAVFGEWGLTTGLFYWGVVFLLVLGIRSPESVSWGVVAVLLVPPLLATAFGGRIVDRIRGKEPEEDLSGDVFKPLELTLASITNTMSFVRVPAFALNHAVLMASVFLVARLLEGNAGRAGFASIVDIVVGNIFVIVLEGLIVFVQTMRLHYYEFFGKFFHHQGRRFEPLAFEDGRRQA